MTPLTAAKDLACSLVVMVCGAMASSAIAASPDRELPAPTGKLPVGRVTFFWADESRLEPQTEAADDHRELRVDVWYPAEPPAGAMKAPYFPDLPALGKKLGAETFLLGAISGHALAAPPIVPGAERYPLVVISPGFGNSGFQYTGLAEELVSHGYVVATVDHPFQSRAIAYPDGRILSVLPFDSVADPQSREKDYRARIEVLAADLRFVVDQLTRLNAGQGDKQFAGRLDLERVAVVGHSIGGIAAAKAALADTRCKAVVNLDGHQQGLPFMLDDQGHPARQPFLEMTDGSTPPTDKQLADWKITRAQFDEQSAANTKRVNELMGQIDEGFRVTAPGIRHASFSDMAMWDVDSLAARHRRIQLVRDYTRAFLDRILRKNGQTLLDASTSPYAEVKVERFGPSR